MNASRPRQHASRAAAVALLVVSVGIAVFSGFFSLIAVDVVAASRIAELGPGSWIGRPGEWQWHAITTLGVAGALAAACIVPTRSRGRRLSAFAVGWAISEGGLWRLVNHASPNTGADLVLWQLAGAALLVTALVITPAER